ncbi:transcriptional regulator, ArsR family [Chloroherpeton thalassium ATCC 35110]|uniref:Transcriptional regulator, ArsR family n=1 Tax=Chloroherpeton thalassium (strain ATCC 35110 / GB-78) TaxID=517418 RepID=B3QZ35_CHLT3|nr:metalloregulator ArsR/SmtB family transcription factor [Chloroherpeton thalassium]ACF13728.1 transcriptional regulator, ArsR family [Chloroherpeton thalassium ATCC 35110]
MAKTVKKTDYQSFGRQMPDEMLNSIANRFKVLSEPMRLKILRAICTGEKTVQEIVEEAEASQANVSKHLSLMYENGLVDRRKDGLKCYYRLADESVFQVCGLISKSIESNLQERLSWVTLKK